jgi:hypothetical protein
MKTALALLALTFLGCAGTPPKSMSWDQENLKRNDKGCPVAIYIAPGGELTQCERQQAITMFPVTVQYTAYDSFEEASLEALKAIAEHPSATHYEWAGMILKTPDGKFTFSKAGTEYAGDHVNIRNDSNGLEVVGGYHTHPCLPDHDVEFFSPEDLIMPIFLHRIAVMGDFCTGNIHEFIPGDKPDVEHPPGDPESVWMTKGRIIGKFTTRTGPAPL